MAFDGLVADKAVDSDALVAERDRRGAKSVISQHPGRARKREIDAALHMWCHLTQNFSGSSRGRTIAEIFAWSTLSAAERQAVMDSVTPQAEAIRIPTRDALDRRSIGGHDDDVAA